MFRSFTDRIRIRRGVMLAVTAAVVTGSVLAPSGSAEAATYSTVCGQRTTSPVYAGYGDANQYFLATAGDFETAAPSGWTLSGATTVPGNSPYPVSVGSTNASSLKIVSDGWASSSPVCVVAGEDSIRFAYRAPGVAGARLKVEIFVTSTAGSAVAVYTLMDNGVAGWKLSDRMEILNRVDTTGAQSLRFRFTATGGAWQVDDLNIDPWRTL